MESKWVELDKEEEEDEDDDMDTNDSRIQEAGVVPISDNAGDAPEGSENGPDVLATAAKSCTSYQTFLSTLSGDAQYQQLLLLMDSTKVSLLAFSLDWALLMIT